MKPAAAALRTPPRASRWVLAAGVGLALAVTAALGTLIWRDRTEVLQAQQARFELLVRVLEDHATRSIETVSLATGTLAELAEQGAPPSSPALSAAMQQTLVNLPFLRGLAWLDGAGQVLSSTDATEVGLTVPVALLGTLPTLESDAIGNLLHGRAHGGAARRCALLR
ncbi:MAG: hypothetical protein ACKOD9_12610, partial [Rubrivivax sp.]